MIRQYIKKYWFYALLAPLFMVGEVMMDLLQPRLMSKIIDEGVLGLTNNNTADMSLIVSTGIEMIGIVAIGGIFGILSGIFANLCSQNLGNDIRKDCFRRIMSLSFEQTDEFSTGSLVIRVTNDVTQVQNLVTQSIRGFIRTSMLFGGGIFFLFMMDIWFGAVVLCALPFVFVSILFFIRKANPNFLVLQKKLDGVNNVMQENVRGARVVKAYVREEHEKKRFEKANEELVSTQLKVLNLFSYMTPITNIIFNLSVVVLIKIGAVQVQNGGVTPGNVVAAITYLSQIMQSVMMLAMIFQTVSRGNASAERLKEVLDCVPVIRGGVHEGGNQTKGKIEFRNVFFAYPGSSKEAVLKGIDLTVYPGETLAILGATGSGKTSLVNLVPRFYDATSGQVLVDGIDVRDYPLKELRDKVAVALQRSEMFSGTIKENILWGNTEASDKAVEKAADAAQAREFIEEKPEKYDAVVVERGMNLSGGQRQRIAIARAVLKSAEILVFDDSTSALDLKTEAMLSEALRREFADTTKIIIAQRIASVMGADRIAIIEDGEIAACGTHEMLLKNNGIYQEIYNSQLKDGGDFVGQHSA